MEFSRILGKVLSIRDVSKQKPLKIITLSKEWLIDKNHPLKPLMAKMRFSSQKSRCRARKRPPAPSRPLDRHAARGPESRLLFMVSDLPIPQDRGYAHPEGKIPAPARPLGGGYFRPSADGSRPDPTPPPGG